MNDLTTLIQQGSAHAWLYIPLAILLGALHGLEPGHSKTMMAAFIVAIRGTVMQAIILGVSATVSHTAVVWVVALAGLYFGNEYGGETSEPYFQLVSGLIIVAVSLWMIIRTWRHSHAHSCGHHHHHPERKAPDGNITTGQLITFGLTGGLLPCPAAITVLLLCLQVKQMALGAALVLGFSVGLALTLVGAGIAASLGARHIASRWPGFEKLAERAPYISGTIIGLLGLYVAWHGLSVLI